MILPDKIFFTGAPGSRWSGVARILENIPGINSSDSNDSRLYTHHKYNGHTGAYFGKNMEFNAEFDDAYIDQAWAQPGGCKIVKSHDWAYSLSLVKVTFPDSWIMMVYRPDLASYAWWHEVGGFNIEYPDYSWYENSTKMMAEIAIQNDKMLKFAFEHNLTWSPFNAKWVKEQFGHDMTFDFKNYDVLVTMLKPT